MASWHYPTQVDHLTATRIHLLRRRRVCNHMTKLMSLQPTFAHGETWGLRLLLSISLPLEGLAYSILGLSKSWTCRGAGRRDSGSAGEA